MGAVNVNCRLHRKSDCTSESYTFSAQAMSCSADHQRVGANDGPGCSKNEWKCAILDDGHQSKNGNIGFIDECRNLFVSDHRIRLSEQLCVLVFREHRLLAEFILQRGCRSYATGIK